MTSTGKCGLEDIFALVDLAIFWNSGRIVGDSEHDSEVMSELGVSRQLAKRITGTSAWLERIQLSGS